MSKGFSGARRLFLAGCAALAAAPKALAQTVYPIKFSGPQPQVWKERKKVAIPSYEMIYITSQQGNAVASIGARVQLNAVIANPDYALMKRLTNEAYADLRSKLTAAGIPLCTDEETKAAVAPLAEPLPNNLDVTVAGGGITVNQSVKIGWTAFGADTAPILKAFHNPGNSSMGGLAQISATGKIGNAGKQLGAVLLLPQLTFDFVNMNTQTSNNSRGSSANVGGAVQFALKSPSWTIIIVPQDKGLAYDGRVRITADAASNLPFATTLTGPSIGDTRIDTVTVNWAIWEPMVRQAFQDYNAALTAAIVKSRG